MRLVTWNVNSLRARIERVVAWIEKHPVDVLCLQETKCEDGAFPREPFTSRGWHVEIFGQKTYNGVALLSREPLRDLVRGLPGFSPEAGARVIAGTWRDVRIVDVYVPNGQEVGADKYVMKLAWLERLRGWLGETLTQEQKLVVCGDFNIAPDDRDVYDAEKLRGTILCSDAERERFQGLLGPGLTDALRMFTAEPAQFTFWDYRAAGFRRNLGYRIDHFLLSQPLAAHCRSVTIDREERQGEKPSDHAPVIAEFDG